MQRDANAYLWDILDAARSILSFTRGKTPEDYLADEMLRAAVERKFGVIGEALSKLLQLVPEYRARITLPEQIVAFRNQLIHGYASVRDDLVWEIVQTYLPKLQDEVAALFEELAEARK